MPHGIRLLTFWRPVPDADRPVFSPARFRNTHILPDPPVADYQIRLEIAHLTVAIANFHAICNTFLQKAEQKISSPARPPDLHLPADILPLNARTHDKGRLPTQPAASFIKSKYNF